MRMLALVVACLALSVSAHAGENPDINIFLEFENGQNTIDPGGPDLVTATVYLENLGTGSGVTAVELMLAHTFGGYYVSRTILAPGWLDFGDPVSGWQLAGACALPDGNGRVALATATYFYSGTPGTLQFVEYPPSSRTVLDCSMGEDTWCVRLSPSGHGAVGPGAEPPLGDCPTGDLHPHRWDVPGEIATIQAASDMAAAGDTVYVAPGIYSTSETGDQFPIILKDGIVLLSSAGPEATILDAEGHSKALVCASSACFDTFVWGFTITNGAAYSGAGLTAWNFSRVVIVDCIFEGNEAADAGGAVVAGSHSIVILTSCGLRDNKAGQAGGAVCVESSTCHATGCVFSGNRARGRGGAVRAWNTDTVLTLDECTFCRNACPEGSSVYVSGSLNTYSLARCIIAYGIGGDPVGGDGSVYIDCSDVYGHACGNWTGAIQGQLNWPNFESAPMFCGAADGDYSLHPDSPCRAMYSPCGELVGALGEGTCSSWPGELPSDEIRVPGDLPTISDALAYACGSGTITVAAGTYAASTNAERFPLVVPAGVVLTSESGPDFTIIDAEEQSRVFTLSGPESATQRRIEGFTVAGGMDTTASFSHGGGMLVETTAAPRISDCIFTDNIAEVTGGAVYCDDGTAPQFHYCEFGENQAYYGGGVGIDSASPVFTYSTFRANQASDQGFGGGGAAIVINASTPVFSHCTFEGNRVMPSDNGAAILLVADAGYNSDILSSVIANTEFGRAVTVRTGNIEFVCSDIHGNDAGDWTGSIADQLGTNGNISVLPGFCDPVNGDLTLTSGSVCLPENNSCGQLIGALGQGCVSGPVMELAPSSLSLLLELSGTTSEGVTINNTGDVPLQWESLQLSATEYVRNSGSGHEEEVLALPPESRAERCLRPRPRTRSGRSPTRERGSGGPDGFGYTWSDSDDPLGPAFVWEDICLDGVPIDLHDEDYVEVDLPFLFPFYGVNRTSVAICANGFLTFDPVYGEGSWMTQGIPTTAYPDAFIAPFWSDLLPSAGGSVHYRDDSDQFYVQYTDVPYWGGGGSLTFQAVLESTGDIRFYYLDVGVPEPPDTFAMVVTVGVEDWTGTDGLEVACNEAYLRDSLAVEILTPPAPPPWLTWNVSRGTVPGGDAGGFTIEVDPGGLPPGRYQTCLRVFSNDPSAPQTDIPVTLDLVETAVDDGGLPDRFALKHNRPNPFNPATEIIYELPQAVSVKVCVFNSAGQLVRTLVDVPLQQPGSHRVIWDGASDAGRPVASGVYFYSMNAGDYSGRRKMVLLK